MATLTIELPPHVTQGQMIEALESLNCELRLSRDGRNYLAVPKKPTQRPETSALLRQATIFRRQYDKTHNGYVIFFRGKAVTWTAVLDHPERWEPGCLAIDLAGRQWVAEGGSTYDGALRWSPAAPAPAANNVTRLPTRVRAVHQPGPGAA